MDNHEKVKVMGSNFEAAREVVDHILEDPNQRGYLIDLVYLLMERYGTVTHPQDLLALLTDGGGEFHEVDVSSGNCE